MCTVAANNAGKCYREVLQAAERFMTTWHEIEATLSRHRNGSATDGPLRNRKGGSNSRRETAVGESWKEMADRPGRLVDTCLGYAHRKLVRLL